MGGLCNSVPAPLLFDRLTEYPIGLALAALLVAPALPGALVQRLGRRAAPVPAIVLLLLGLGLAWQASRTAPTWRPGTELAVVATLAFGAMAAALSSSRAWFTAAALAGLALPAFLVPLSGSREVFGGTQLLRPSGRGADRRAAPAGRRPGASRTPKRVTGPGGG